MREIFYLSFILGFTSGSHASLPKNGVIITATSLEELLNEQKDDSAYNLCIHQSRGARFFSNNCTRLIEALRKKMNVMILESDLQIQAERLAKRPLSQACNARIAMLAKINLLATQAEDTIKAAQTNPQTGDTKEVLPDILPSVKRVQISFSSYSRLYSQNAK